MDYVAKGIARAALLRAVCPDGYRAVSNWAWHALIEKVLGGGHKEVPRGRHVGARAFQPGEGAG